MKISSNLSIINLNFPQQYLIHTALPFFDSILQFTFPSIPLRSIPGKGGAVRKNAFVTLHSSVGAPLNCAPTKNPSLNWDGGLGPYFLWPLPTSFFFLYCYYYYYFHSALVPILIKSGPGTCAATGENLLLRKHREKRTMKSNTSIRSVLSLIRFTLWWSFSEFVSEAHGPRTKPCFERVEKEKNIV